MVKRFRVQTDPHPMNEIDSFVPWSIIQLHLLNKSLTSVFSIGFVKVELMFSLIFCHIFNVTVFDVQIKRDQSVR